MHRSAAEASQPLTVPLLNPTKLTPVPLKIQFNILTCGLASSVKKYPYVLLIPHIRIRATCLAHT
jgi:hypothetical protein